MHLIGIFSLYINDHPFLQEDVNRKLNFGLEALVEAVTTGNDKASEFLTHLELDRHTNSEGKTALMFACERGHEDIVRTLLSAGANVNIQDNKGWTALMIASKHNHISIIHMLLQVHADGSDALLIASYYGNYEVVELLISKGVDYNYQREDGANAFMLACQNGHNEVVKLLLMERVDPNVQNKEGRTALMLASTKGHYEVVKLLLEWKADPTIKSMKGNTALSLSKHSKIKALINDNMDKKDDAVTVTSGYRTTAPSDISSMSSCPSTLTL